MKKIIISSDSTCDLSEEIIEKYNIQIMPLHVSLDGKDYRDGIDIKADDIYRIYDEKKILPKTSAPNILEYYELFKKYDREEYDIIHISLGSSISSAFQNASLASKEFTNVDVIDSANLSTGSGLIILKAIDLINENLSVKEIVEQLEVYKNKVETSFILDSLLYLKEGGRCSSLTALGANLLKIKPCIEVNNEDSRMNVGKKYRGNLDNVLINYINDKLSDLSRINKERIFITHSGIDEYLLELVKNHLESLGHFNQILITSAGCTISSHCGPNTLGIVFSYI